MNHLPTDLPAASVVSATSRPSGYFVAKEGLSLVRDNGENLNILGFGLSTDPSSAKSIAHFEFLERFWSFYPACSGLVDVKSRVPAYEWPDTLKQTTVAAGSVMLGFKEKGSKRDATGLACGTSIDDAAERAVLELCERHLLARFWCKDDISLSLFRTHSLEEEGVVAEYFAIEEDPPLPFCIVTLKVEGGLWVVGSAMGRTLTRAADKAFLEAAMLFDSMSQKHLSAYNSQTANGRYERYVSGGFEKAEETFLGKVNRRGLQRKWELEREDPLEVIVTRVLGEEASKILITPIIRQSEYTIVSAFSAGALKPSDFRKDENELTDPFF